jgi:uncharacterized protein involved in outer membrane biogenesis
VIVFLFAVWVAESGGTILIGHTRLRSLFIERLSTAFGRSVQVGSFRFSVWTGPAVEAESVIVVEDPRFGHEFFLRADSVTARLRWQGLVRGKLELGTISLLHPTLNLVCNEQGDWNLAEWLPHPSPSHNDAAPSESIGAEASRPLRIGRIEVDSGRINFKRGVVKIPFALTGVRGFTSPEGPGRWHIDIEATPERAAVVLQQTGTLHLSGDVGGTSSRLRPAALNFSLESASIPDVLRLAQNNDFGVRGVVRAALDAHSDGEDWVFAGRAELREMHRWDLVSRTDNPQINLIAKARLSPGDSHADLSEVVLEAPRSNVRASGTMDWSDINEPGAKLQISNSIVSASDLLDWVRAFRSSVAGDIAVQGTTRISAVLNGWPPHLEEGTVRLEDAELTGDHLRRPIRASNTSIHYDGERFTVSPVGLSFGAADGTIHLETAPGASHAGGTGLRIYGNVSHSADLVAVANAFGWNLSRGWGMEGPLRCDLRWTDFSEPWKAQPVGMVEWGGESGTAYLRAPFLNQPIDQIRARADWKPGSHHIAISSARAFGARWSGTFDRHYPAGAWQFSLQADKLSTEDLDRWLNPRWRQSFLDRVLPFLSPQPSFIALPENLHASGQISVEQFALASFVTQHLQAGLVVDGRRLRLEDARGQFYGGNAGVSLDAELRPEPNYRGKVSLARVDLSALSNASPGLADLFAGTISGDLTFSAEGASKAALVSSLECQGTASVTGGEWRSISLRDSFRTGEELNGVTPFHEASGDFSCRLGKVVFQKLVLTDAFGELNAAGAADFGRNLDFRLSLNPDSHGSDGKLLTGLPNRAGNFDLTGTLTAPALKPAPAPIAIH